MMDHLHLVREDVAVPVAAVAAVAVVVAKDGAEVGLAAEARVVVTAAGVVEAVVVVEAVARAARPPLLHWPASPIDTQRPRLTATTAARRSRRSIPRLARRPSAPGGASSVDSDESAVGGTAEHGHGRRGTGTKRNSS